MSPSRFVVGMLSLSLITIGIGVASGQEYPNKPIRVIAGPAGGGGDFVARIIAQGISVPLGQPVIVDNRPSVVAPELLIKAPPDGYTIQLSGGSLWISPLLRKVSYDMLADYSFITVAVKEPLMLAVHPSVAASSVKELIALAKAKPGGLNYAAATIGGSPHLSAELLKSLAGVNIVRINYKGNAPAITGLISGEVQMVILDVGLLAPHVKAGKLKALAVTSAERSALAPELPTVAASGLPGYESIGASGVFAPSKTPLTAINRLNQEIVRFLNRADVKERLLNAGEEIVANTPAQAATFVKSDMARWSKVIKDADIRVE